MQWNSKSTVHLGFFSKGQNLHGFGFGPRWMMWFSKSAALPQSQRTLKETALFANGRMQHNKTALLPTSRMKLNETTSFQTSRMRHATRKENRATGNLQNRVPSKDMVFFFKGIANSIPIVNRSK